MSEKKVSVIVAGSRTITDYDCLVAAIETSIVPKYGKDFKVISGGAKGVDQLAKQYATINQLEYKEYKPIYKSANDRTAPLRRNQDMALVGDVLVAIWDGQSRGTQHMIECMQKLNKSVYVF